MPSDAAAVLAANEAFYRAFDRGDLDAMRSLWSERASVACIHPGWAPLFGHGSVLDSWRAILEGTGSPQIACVQAHAFVQGESAFVVCTERLGDGSLVATNIFVREDEAWKLVHHQAGPTPTMDPPAEGTVH